MINKKIGVLLLFALLVSFGAKAQRATSMRINEVLVDVYKRQTPASPGGLNCLKPWKL